MTPEEIANIIPSNWLRQHQEEHLALSEKIARTILFSKAIESKWGHNLKSEEDYQRLIEEEAKNQDISPEEVRYFLLQAGQIKAALYIFEKHYIPTLPKDEEGKCSVPKESILKFVHQCFEEENKK